MTHSLPSLTALVLLALTGPGSAAGPDAAAARQAHDAYVAAINANDATAYLAAVTDDIVLIAPNAPAMTGKTQVAPWVAGYFDAVRTSWSKQSIEFVVSDGWAFELYAYTAVDTPMAGGRLSTDTGHGINIYRRGDDGVWRVARDAWASDRPGPATAAAAADVPPGCAIGVGPC